MPLPSRRDNQQSPGRQSRASCSTTSDHSYRNQQSRASLDTLAKDPRFASLAEAEAYLRSVHATFGDLSDDQWAHLAAWSAVAEEDGSYRLHYDPAIAKAFSSGPSEDVSLWPVWEAVCCPTLVVRGAKSELLTADTASEMVRRGAAGAAGAVRVAEIAGVGHAPALMSEHQIALLCEFLAEGFSS